MIETGSKFKTRSLQAMRKVHRTGLTQISASDPASDSHYRVNIIFVHGLRGHPRETWEDSPDRLDGDESPKTPNKRKSLGRILKWKRSAKEPDTHDGDTTSLNKVFWPADFLDDDLPTARVWTYGYNADVIGMFEANNTNSVSQHGRDLSVKLERDIQNEDPMIFVAHSLGGIIMKDALQRSEQLQSQTRSVIFLGTPHRGSNLAAWGAIASKLAKLALQDSNKRILDALKVDSEVFDNIHEKFQEIVLKRGIKVHSFQEAQGISGVKGLSGKVVDDFSSKLGLAKPHETVETIDANHMQMARCRTKDDSQYRAIVAVLRQLIRTGPGTNEAVVQTTLSSPAVPSSGMGGRDMGDSVIGASTTSDRQPCYYIQLSENPHFTGRTTILDRLKKTLFAQKQFRKAALVGLGGVGKTQVASQFVYWVKEERPDYSIFWVPILSEGSVEQAYVDIAKVLGVKKGSDDDDIKKLVCQYLSSKEAGRWLLVLDNADDHELVFGSDDKPGLEQYLPESENGLILLTTRSRQVAIGFEQSNVIDVEQMDCEEASQLFEKSLIKGCTIQDDALITELLGHLTYLPLAITQAAAYINQTKAPIRQYLSLLQGAEKEVASVLGRDFKDSTRYRDSQNAVATAWLVSFNQIEKHDRAAVKMLSFISCIEPKAIPQSILPNTNAEELIWGIGTLCGYSFLTRRGDSDTFDMHSLVHMAARLWLEEQGMRESVLKEVIRHLGGIFPSAHWSNRDTWREYFPHAFRILDRSVGCELVLEDRHSLVNKVGNCLDADRRFKEAILFLQEVCDWNRERLPEDDHSRLTSEHELASAYLENRQVEKAIKMLEHIIRIKEETLDKKDHSRLASEHELASAYLNNRQVEKAIKMLEHIVGIEEETLDKKDHSRLDSEHELARAYLANNQAQKAVGLLEHVVAVESQILGEDDPDRVLSLDLLQDAYAQLDVEGETPTAESSGLGHGSLHESAVV